MERYGDIRRLTWRGMVRRRYYVRVYRDDGKTTWKCTGFADRECAEAVVKRWQLEAIQGAGAPKTPSVSEAIATWSELRAAGRSYNYGRLLAAFAKRTRAAFFARPIASMTNQDIAAYILTRVRECTPRTVNLDIKLFRDFFSWCIERDYIARNPASNRMLLPVPHEAPIALTAEEEARLLACAREFGERQYGFVLLLLETGFRSWLASHLRWQNIDLERGIWKIPAAMMKSRREYTQPISSVLLAWLRTQTPDDEYLFGPCALVTWWKSIRARAGMPTLKRHDLRRNFVTRCRRAGVPVEVAAALSDHADIRTMMSVYRRVDETDTRAALERIDAARKECHALPTLPLTGTVGMPVPATAPVYPVVL